MRPRREERSKALERGDQAAPGGAFDGGDVTRETLIESRDVIAEMQTQPHQPGLIERIDRLLSFGWFLGIAGAVGAAVLITGASSGLGYALAKYVLEKGDHVVLGARTLSAMTELAARYPKTALALERLGRTLGDHRLDRDLRERYAGDRYRRARAQATLPEKQPLTPETLPRGELARAQTARAPLPHTLMPEPLVASLSRHPRTSACGRYAVASRMDRTPSAVRLRFRMALLELFATPYRSAIFVTDTPARRSRRTSSATANVSFRGYPSHRSSRAWSLRGFRTRARDQS